MPQSITIIGGNIAGLSAAYYLARKGCPVTIYESKIWDKPCGGAVSIEYAQYLSRELGLDLYPENQLMPHVRFCFANHRCIETDPLFVVISRARLQQLLIQRLQKEPGIRFIFKHVTLKNTGLFSPQTILATGFSGFTRQVIGKEWYRREYARTLKYTDRFCKNIRYPLNLMLFNSRIKGYGWLFCSINNQFNIGIGGLIEKKIIFEKYQDLINLINRRFNYGIRPKTPPAVWRIPIAIHQGDAPVSFHKNGIEYIGAGDALGLAHPVIAAGIEPAWQSGWLLGESYDASKHAINVSRYRRLLKKNLRLTSRKPFDIIVSRILRTDWFPLKDQLSYVLMKQFHKRIIGQIKKYPWFAMVHDGKKKTGFKSDTFYPD